MLGPCPQSFHGLGQSLANEVTMRGIQREVDLLNGTPRQRSRSTHLKSTRLVIRHPKSESETIFAQPEQLSLASQCRRCAPTPRGKLIPPDNR